MHDNCDENVCNTINRNGHINANDNANVYNDINGHANDHVNKT